MLELNRTQYLVLGFIAVAVIALLLILRLAPELYDAQLRPLGLGGPYARAGFLGAIAVLLVLLVIATVHRWRWSFWLLLVAMAAGILRLPAFGAQLVGILPLDVPTWYATLQAFLGLVQVGVALLMYVGYRRHGVWGAF
jgi:hypothetical protein